MLKVPGLKGFAGDREGYRELKGCGGGGACFGIASGKPEGLWTPEVVACSVHLWKAS